MRTILTVTVSLLLLLAGISSIGSTPADVPLPQMPRRQTPLHFGLAVKPDEHNPIQPPERFIGIHTGTDFEILPGEADVEVPVKALCGGEVIFSSFAEGYGGVLVQRCRHGDEPVTVLYGHLLLASLAPSGTVLQRGDRLGVLAPARSHDSDGNRKHLHLGIHRGESLVLLGYVQEESELADFIDAQPIIRHGSLSAHTGSGQELDEAE